MTVAELIITLQAMPPDAEVQYIWDGYPRSTVESVWLARNGSVMLGDIAESVYGTEARPTGAPTREEDADWSIPNQLSQA